MNSCMSITKNLLLYFIECNCDEWLYEYYKGSTVVFIECYCDEFLYEYYKGSIVVLYWTLTVMNGWMKNMKGLLLCYTEC
jgi:hypothetical protein